ncbi:MAG: SOS response-associated peptidase [Bilifractor sp.]|jgi:putative SOS response-associated peptidase YedK
MCTRFFIEPSEEIDAYTEAAGSTALLHKMTDTLAREFKTSGEIRPTDIAAVIAPSSSEEKTVYPMVWGYHIPGVKGPVVNARIESARDKASFSSDWRRHRCIIPASCYFEWEHIKMPDGRVKTGEKYAIRPRSSGLTFLAGLYRIEESRGLKYPVFTVLTREPTAELARIHNRMPVILPREAIDDWIRPDADPDKIASDMPEDMIVKKAASVTW